MKCHNDICRDVFKVPEIAFGRQVHMELDGAKYTPPFDLCSYCGSLSISDTIKAFQTKGVVWSGSDWKYDWPHKFYLQIPCEPRRKCTSKGPKDTDLGYSICTQEYCKFYSEHLIDATVEQLKLWHDIVAPITGIDFQLEGERLKWVSEFGVGYQGYGVIA